MTNFATKFNNTDRQIGIYMSKDNNYITMLGTGGHPQPIRYPCPYRPPSGLRMDDANGSAVSFSAECVEPQEGA